MYKYIFLVFFLCPFSASFAQESEVEEPVDTEMNNEKLGFIIKQLSDEVEGENGAWRFLIDSTMFICLTDENFNRMRVISPIVEAGAVTPSEMQKCMEANFHTALDSKYAISDGVLWAVFIHPLKELSAEQVISAISQVFSSARTFGTIYSSGELSFPKSEAAMEKEKKKSKKT